MSDRVGFFEYPEKREPSIHAKHSKINSPKFEKVENASSNMFSYLSSPRQVHMGSQELSSFSSVNWTPSNRSNSSTPPPEIETEEYSQEEAEY